MIYFLLYSNVGLPLWLLPLQLPSSNENLEDDLSRHRTLCNDHYKNAIKYLRHALHSSPPVLEAFHPLIQVIAYVQERIHTEFFKLYLELLFVDVLGSSCMFTLSPALERGLRNLILVGYMYLFVYLYFLHADRCVSFIR